jgi:hypothetical protein
MYQKTESSEFGPGFLWQICLLTILAIGFGMFSQKLFWPEKIEPMRSYTTVLFPWVIAGGHTIGNGLLAFGGKPPELPTPRDEASALAGLLIAVVLCPTIFLLEWRRRRVFEATKHERQPLKVSSVFYALTGAITLYMAAAMLPITIASESARTSLRHAVAVQFNRDAIINEMNLIEIDLLQYYILPKKLGGGNHTYDGFRLRQQLKRTDDASYVVSVEKSQVDIHASSVRFPSCRIDVKVDSAGRMTEWNYGGEFR